MVASLTLGKKKRITNVKNKTMPYNNSPAKKYGAVHMKPSLGPKMMGKPLMMKQPPILSKCGSKRHK